MDLRLPFSIVFIHVFLIFAPVTSQQQPSASENAAVMEAFAKSITSPLPSGWSAAGGIDPCGLKSKWFGVSCENGKITSINLRSRSISGTLPSEIGNLVSLRALSLQGNSFTGALPSFRKLAALQQIYLSDNNFTSIPVDTFFTGLTSLVAVSLDRNPFEDWVIPDDLSQSANLINFTAMNSGVSGSIPSFFGEMVSLQSLRLSYNNLVGGIPASFAGSGIKELQLNNQKTAKLSGGISVLGLMPQLKGVLLQSNNFTGDIPDLSNCTSLESLNLRDNRFTGVVPESLSRLKSLKDLTLANNLLQGPFPDISPAIWKDVSDANNNFCNTKPGPCDRRVDLLIKVAGGFGYPVVLADSWKGNDPCAKWIFVICDSHENITVLNFGNQRFGGIISPDLAEIQTLKTVILSNNNLTGTIPDKLAALPQLETLDVSGNNLTGKIPDFRPTVTFKHSGNPLLGQDLPDRNDQTSITGKSKSKGDSIWIPAVIVIVVVVGIFGLLCIFIVCYRRRRRRQADLESSDFKLVDIEHSAGKKSSKAVTSKADDASDNMLMSVNTLRIATDNFNKSNILGRGGFGVVYRGKLPNGNVIAVKRMECSEIGKKGSTEFEAEIAVLTKVRHRHLVGLCGYSIEGQEKLLVYEFMPQGTLCHHLFPTGGDHPPALNWKQRLIIALDVARGVEYLHSLAQTSFSFFNYFNISLFLPFPMDYDLQLSLGTKVLPLSFPEKRRWPESPDSMAPSTVKRTKSAVKGIDVNKLPTEDWDVAGVEEEATISSPVSAVSSVSAGKRPPREETDENERGDCSGGEPTATSTASDDDEGENGSKKKLRLSKEQSSVLEESFKKHSTLNPKQKLALSSVVNLTPRQVEVWFQNRRARTKLKQTEWDCEYLKRYCEKLTEENRRLHIDVNELRTLRLSQSPNLFAPPTTISICQLCQQTSTGTINPQPQEADAVKGERKSGNGIEWRCPAPPQKQPHVFFPHRPTAMLAWSSTSTGSVVPFPDARSQR